MVLFAPIKSSFSGRPYTLHQRFRYVSSPQAPAAAVNWVGHMIRLLSICTLANSSIIGQNLSLDHLTLASSNTAFIMSSTKSSKATGNAQVVHDKLEDILAHVCRVGSRCRTCNLRFQVKAAITACTELASSDEVAEIWEDYPETILVRGIQHLSKTLVRAKFDQVCIYLSVYHELL